jgi:subtilisin family serine protease
LTSQVKWVRRQRRLIRKKRDLIDFENSKRDKNIENFNDPLWSKMWYLNRNSIKNLLDLNTSGAWSMGYSGKGVCVTFVDDGIEWDHPDLIENYYPKASYDFNDNDDNPMPRYDPLNSNK